VETYGLHLVLQKEGRPCEAAFGHSNVARLIIHVAHAAHTAWRHAGSLGLRFLRHHSLGGNKKSRDGARVLQGGAYHLGGVDHALLDEVAVLA
jgi:hypothetical protein